MRLGSVAAKAPSGVLVSRVEGLCHRECSRVSSSPARDKLVTSEVRPV